MVVRNEKKDFKLRVDLKAQSSHRLDLYVCVRERDRDRDTERQTQKGI